MQRPIRYSILGIILFSIVGAGYAVYHWRASVAAPISQNDATGTNIEDATVGAPVEIPLAQAPAGYIPYRNAKYRFALSYPPELKVSEYDEGGGASTITFQGGNENAGFQVFIIPYNQSQVTAHQFKQDEPSGIIQNPVAVVIDNTKGTMFFGKNPVMGDTREVWFIHGGYLYEVTTYKQLDTWLADIMKTWRFE